LKIDDSLDVFPVHGVGGALGTILCAIFVSTSWGGNGTEASISTQFIGVFATGIYAAVVSYILLKIINIFSPIRASDEHEQNGLDVSQHGEAGYNNL